MVMCVSRLVLAASALAADATEHRHSVKANPVRKVVTMLQALQTKVEAEGEKEQAMFEKFMCYCKSGTARLEETVAEGKARVPALVSGIEQHAGKLVQLKEDLKQHNADRISAKTAVAEATQVREKEKVEFDKFSGDASANLGAVSKAIAALEKGTTGFLQTSAAVVLQNLALSKMQLFEADRQDLLSFLSGGQGMGYMPASSEIQGILKQMKDTMVKDLSDATAREKEGVASYGGLMVAKRREMDALTGLIEQKSSRAGELSVSIQTSKDDLRDTEDDLKQDERFLQELGKDCGKKRDVHADSAKERTDELLALAETIKVLNDDDVLEIFKKSLPETSTFLQLQSTAHVSKVHVLAIAEAARTSEKGGKVLDLVSLAFQGKKVNFKQVAAVIDKFVAEMGVEQKVDNEKKMYCNKEFAASQEKRRTLKKSLTDTETSIADSDERVSSIKEDIKKLGSEIVSLDQSVTEATNQRKEEHDEVTTVLGSNAAAKQLLGFAKNRLNKFYNPKMYKAPPDPGLVSDGEQVAGPTLSPNSVAGIIAGAGSNVPSFAEVASHVQAKGGPVAPHVTFLNYMRKSEASGGVIALIDLLMQDLDKESQKAAMVEKDAQEDYEAMLTVSSEKRSRDARSISDKEGALAELEASDGEIRSEKLSHEKDLAATIAYRQSIHSDCDWLLKFFDTRQAARASEVEALRSAKATLHGADFSS